MLKRKKKNFREVFDEHLNDDSNYEENRFNYFTKKYMEKLNDENFNIDKERCKLTIKINDQTPNAIIFYVSIVITTFTFILSNIINYFFRGFRTLVFSNIIGFFIFGITFFVIRYLLKKNNNSDIWQIALIALESVVREKHESDKLDKSKSFTKEANLVGDEVVATGNKENNKIIETIANDIKQIKKFHGIS